MKHAHTDQLIMPVSSAPSTKGDLLRWVCPAIDRSKRERESGRALTVGGPPAVDRFLRVETKYQPMQGEDEMRKVLSVALVSLCVGVGVHTRASAQGDVGSAECLAVQQDAQAAVSAGGPYKN